MGISFPATNSHQGICFVCASLGEGYSLHESVQLLIDASNSEPEYLNLEPSRVNQINLGECLIHEGVSRIISIGNSGSAYPFEFSWRKSGSQNGQKRFGGGMPQSTRASTDYEALQALMIEPMHGVVKKGEKVRSWFHFDFVLSIESEDQPWSDSWSWETERFTPVC